MDIASAPRKKAYKGLAMEGMLATWYAKNTAKGLAEFEACAGRIAAHLRPESRVLEVAPGPGYLAIALARVGHYRIAGLDISRSFVRIAAENAARAKVEVKFQHGDAAAIPYPADTFDFIVCRAAFKNFGDPVGALGEMHRVLRPGGQTLIIDMRKDASNEAIDRLVGEMKLGRMNALITRAIFKYGLRKKAYSKADFLRMAAATPFRTAEIREEPIGFEVWLRK
ncbi:MAG: class I SAM-dependent methyltransferase [Xanthobacteraceae bacterium]